MDTLVRADRGPTLLWTLHDHNNNNNTNTNNALGTVTPSEEWQGELSCMNERTPIDPMQLSITRKLHRIVPPFKVKGLSSISTVFLRCMAVHCAVSLAENSRPLAYTAVLSCGCATKSSQ